MSIPAGLPRHRPDHQSYQRPNQRWVCGWLRAGYQCRPGPSPAGECLNRAECSPRRRGGGWLCTRTRDDGGACSAGPLPDGRCRHPLIPCQPQRSLQQRRTVLTVWTLLLTLGLLLLGYAGPWQEDFLSAGELSNRHAASEAGCSACHNHTAAAGERQRTMSERCQSCHALGEYSRRAHSTDPARLSELSRRRGTAAPETDTTPWQLKMATRLAVTDFSDRDIPCAVCHGEHRGSTGLHADSLADSLDDLQCQSCHSEQFASLSDGHPPFSGYPYQRRTRILFDHARHAHRHYDETDKLFLCADCHEPDAAGQQMQVKSFASVCLDCHANHTAGQDGSSPGKAFHHGEQIVEKRATIAFITIPRIDVGALSEQDRLPDRWPQEAQRSSRDGLTDLGLTPFSELLLATDEETAAALQRLHSAGLKLSSLRRAGAAELQDVAQVLEQFRYLLAELADDENGWQQRMQQILQFAGSSDVYSPDALLAQLPQPLRRIPASDWFGGIATVPAATVAAGITEPPVPPAGSNAVRTGSWNAEKFSLRYHPGGHADDFIKSWLQLSLQLAGTDTRLAPFALRLFGELADSDAAPGEAKGPGRCTKCHSVEGREDGTRFINWQAFQPQPQYHDFVRFRHQPHLQLDAGEACTLCHRLQESGPAEQAKSQFLQSFLNSDPADFTGNFSAIDKTTCSTCHRADSAGARCVTCHYYHIGTLQPRMLQRTGNLLHLQR